MLTLVSDSDEGSPSRSRQGAFRLCPLSSSLGRAFTLVFLLDLCSVNFTFAAVNRLLLCILLVLFSFFFLPGGSLATFAIRGYAPERGEQGIVIRVVEALWRSVLEQSDTVG